MKYLKLLLLLPLFVILVSGCTGDGQQAREIFEAAMNKSAAVTSYTGNYNLDSTMAITGYPSISISGIFDIWKKPDKTKIYGTFDLTALGGEQYSMSIYYLPGGVYGCIDQTTTCSEMEDASGMPMDITSPDQSFEQIQELVDNGIVTLSYLGTKSVAGRTCDNIKAIVDATRINEAMGDIPSDMITPDMQQAMQNAQFYYTICLDQQTGHALEYIMSLSMSMQMTAEQTGTVPMTVSMTILMQMTATAFNPNANIADSVFELPYSVS